MVNRNAMADNENNKECLKEITDSIEQGIRELFQSDRYTQYLRTMSRFHHYSFNNTMLIYMQKPDATLVAGFSKWRDQFERSVRQGEKSIKIIAATPYKKKIEQKKLDPDTKVSMLDAEGKVITEELEVKIQMYKVVSVFDVKWNLKMFVSDTRTPMLRSLMTFPRWQNRDRRSQ